MDYLIYSVKEKYLEYKTYTSCTNYFFLYLYFNLSLVKVNLSSIG